MTSPPTGVFVPVPTFFKPHSASPALQPAVDVHTQIGHSVFLAQNGVRGLVLLGSTGEAIHMSRDERISLVSGVRKGLEDAGFTDYPIMAGTLVNSVDETLGWLQDFKDAGAQWGLVLAPGYFGAAASQEGIREWYTVVADKSPLPILMCVPCPSVEMVEANERIDTTTPA
jgi:2-keto-3-deoxy-L-rhamnonate aldolase